MSTDALSLFKDIGATDLRGTLKPVLWALATFADLSSPQLTCYPGLELIGHTAGVQKRTAMKAIRELQDLGIVRVVKRGSGRRSNRYLIDREAIRSRARSAPQDDVAARPAPQEDPPERLGNGWGPDGVQPDRVAVRAVHRSGARRAPEPRQRTNDDIRARGRTRGRGPLSLAAQGGGPDPEPSRDRLDLVGSYRLWRSKRPGADKRDVDAFLAWEAEDRESGQSMRRWGEERTRRAFGELVGAVAVPA